MSRRFYRSFLRFAFSRQDLVRPAVIGLMNQGSPFPIERRRKEGMSTTILGKSAPGVAWGDLPQAFVKSPDIIMSIIDQLAGNAPATPEAGTWYDSLSGGQGHLATMVRQDKHGDQAKARVSDPRYPLGGPFSAFPNGIVPLPDHLGPDVQADDKVKYLEDHKDEIDKFTDKRLRQPWAAGDQYTGHYIVLGSASLVRCARHEVVTGSDGVVTQVFHLQTTSQHPLDGSYVWAWRYDPRKPGLVTSFGIQAGKHPIAAVDTGNVALGVQLSDAMNAAAPYFMSAREQGRAVITGDYSMVDDAGLALRGRALALGDYGSPLVIWMRKRHGPNTTAETYQVSATDLDKVVAQGPAAIDTSPLPTTTDAPGRMVDGSEFSSEANPFGAPAGPPGSVAALSKFNDLFSYQRTQANLAAIRDRQAAALAGGAGGEGPTGTVADFLAAPQNSLDSQRIIASVMYDPIVPQLQAAFDSAATGKKGFYSTLMQSWMRQWFTTTFTVPQLAPDGAVRVSLELQNLDDRVKSIDRSGLDAKIQDAAARRLAAETAIAGFKEKQQNAADEEEEREIASELTAQEDARDQAEIDEERYQNDKDDVDNYAERRSDLEKGADAAARAFDKK